MKRFAKFLLLLISDILFIILTLLKLVSSLTSSSHLHFHKASYILKNSNNVINE